MHTCTQRLDITKKETSKKVTLGKFIFNVWKNKIMSTLSEVHGTRWPGFDSEEMHHFNINIQH